MGNFSRLVSGELPGDRLLPVPQPIIGAEEWDAIEAEFREARQEIEAQSVEEN